MRNKKEYKSSISGRLTLRVLIVSAVIFTLTFGIFVRMAANRVRHEATKHAHSELSNTIHQIDAVLKDVVKIDRVILLKADSQRGKSLFAGIVELPHKLGLKVTCEGVETEEQDTFASDTRCDYIQGFLYYKPMPKEEFEEIKV